MNDISILRQPPILRIFLVDDSLYIRQRLPHILAQVSQVEIIGEAASASEATRDILRLKPDIVLLDLRLMGVGTGLDVLRAIKQAKPAPTAIILTNHSAWQYRKKCLDAGADFFFDKSTQFEKLVPLLKKLRKQKRRRKNVGLSETTRLLPRQQVRIQP